MIEDHRIKEKFQEWQENHKNPFTPRLEKFDLLEDGIIVEFQTDRAQEFFGVTILQYDSEFEFGDFKVLHVGLSDSFHDRDVAEAFYDSLRVFIAEEGLKGLNETTREEFKVQYNV